jgi:hypothetical protein
VLGACEAGGLFSQITNPIAGLKLAITRSHQHMHTPCSSRVTRCCQLVSHHS